MRAGHRPPPSPPPSQLLCFIGLLHFIRVCWFCVIRVSGGILSRLKLYKCFISSSSRYQDNAERVGVVPGSYSVVSIRPGSNVLRSFL